MPRWLLTSTQATSSVFFGLAIVTAIVRIGVRLYYFRKFFTDDYFLLLALASLIACQYLYLTVTVPGIVNLIPEMSKSHMHTNPEEKAKQLELSNVAQMLIWVTVFAVKFSFLFHFRQLIERVPWLRAWWWTVFGICLTLAATNIPWPWIVCPYPASQIQVKCLEDRPYASKAHAILVFNIVADIVSDCLSMSVQHTHIVLEVTSLTVLVISIPWVILRRARISFHQKFNILVVLSLSIFMIAIALVRAVTSGNSEEQWMFWLQIEPSVAVTAASCMLFRTLFVVTPRSRDRRPSPLKLINPKLRLWTQGVISSIGKEEIHSDERPWYGQGQTPRLPLLLTRPTMTSVSTRFQKDEDAQLPNPREGKETCNKVDEGYGGNSQEGRSWLNV